MKAQAQRDLILETGAARFRQFGIRRVTMDDLARELRISKKTIYAHFADKEAMVAAHTAEVLDEVMPVVQAALAGDGPATPRLAAACRALVAGSRRMSSVFLADLRADYPHLWQRLDERRREVALGFEKLFEDGVESGEMRPELHPQVAMRIVLAVIEHVAVPEVLVAGGLSPQDLIGTTLTMLMRGALSRPDSFDPLRAAEPPRRALRPRKKRPAPKSR